MSKKKHVDDYLHAATRDNTRKAYRSAIEHFEVQWHGVLPATSNQVADYLAHFASTLSFNTLKMRVSALASWHSEQGFADPTKAPIVKKVLKGIRELHPVKEKQAKALQINQLKQVVTYLDCIRDTHLPVKRLRATRDKALILIGFWRGFRSDELTRMEVQFCEVAPKEGMIIYLPRSKSDRQTKGKQHKTPALQNLCPVSAYQDWLAESNLTHGPVFRAINQWGTIAQSGLNTSSIIPIVRAVFTHAGISAPEEFSGHSLRRGFANWASQNNWNVKTLMAYVGWRDVNTAMRYVESNQAFALGHFETQQTIDKLTNEKTVSMRQLSVQIKLIPFHTKATNQKHIMHKIERFCFKPQGITRLADKSYIWHLAEDEQLEETIRDLITTTHAFGNDHKHVVDMTIIDEKTGETWE